MSDNVKKIQDAIQAIRTERLKYVETTLMTRQQENDRISKLAGTTPARAELTISDYQTIEERYNRPLAALKERARLAEAEAGKASIDGLEDQLEKAKQEQAAAAQVLVEKEGAVKSLEGKIDRALRLGETVKERRNVIRFEAKVPDLMSDRITPSRKKDVMQRILSY